MRLVVGGGVGGGCERCMTAWCMREHCMFLIVETLPFFSVSRMVVELCVELVLV